MQFERIHLTNYRSIHDSGESLSDLTVLIGKNNSGKSNFVRSINTYRDIFINRVDLKKIYNGEISHGKAGNELGFSVTYGLTNEERDHISQKITKEHEFDYEFVKNEVDRNWFTNIHHEFRFIEDDITTDRLSVNYQNKLLPISARGNSLPTKNNLPWDSRKDWWTIEPKENRDSNSYFELDFSQFPGNIEMYKNTSAQNRVDALPEYVSEYIREFLSNQTKIGAFRQPHEVTEAYKDQDLDDSGKNLARVLLTTSQNDRNKFGKIEKSFTDVMEGVEGIRAPLVNNPNSGVTIEVDETTGASIPLNSISAGSKEILTLITKIVLASDRYDFLAIEEPELHLHPKAVNKILNLIEDVISSMDIQILISTHSNILVNNIDAGNIIKTDRQGSTVYRGLSDGDIISELEDLGYSKSNLFQAEGVVFVEGRSDKVILEILSKKLNKPLKQRNIEIIVGKGDELKSDLPPITKVLDQLRIPYKILFDSDGEEPDEKRKTLRKDLELSPDKILVLNKYSIESYLIDSPKVLADVLETDISEIEDYLSETKGNKKGELDTDGTVERGGD